MKTHTVCTALLAGCLASSAAAARAGEIYVVNNPNPVGTQILEYDTAGNLINPNALPADAGGGHIYVAGGNVFLNTSLGEEGIAAIAEYTTGGALVNQGLIEAATLSDGVQVGEVSLYAGSGSDLWGWGYGQNGVPYVYEWSTAGTLLQSLEWSGQSSGPYSIAVGDGYVVATTGTSVAEWTTSGTLVSSSLITGLTGGGITISGSDIFVTQPSPTPQTAGTAFVNEYTLSGTFVGSFSGLTYPGAIQAYDGNLYIESAGTSGGHPTTVIGEYTTAGVPINAAIVTDPYTESIGAFYVVPEPSTWILAAIGLAALGVVRRRR
ncbi:MAG TPA: PEP-CTERM sorting domain-containing protein [Pirellulales bacterium]|nr:PEP-CTERM sorting domain-containing protein [Pirellulales bacterium]